MLFTIKDIENLSGIKAHTIRVWEQRYTFLKPKRSGTNIRYYTAEELKTILNVSLLCKYGYRVSQINSMGSKCMMNNIQMLTGAEALESIMVNKLLESMIALDTKEFEAILNGYIEEAGIEKTILHLLFPFLDKAGMLWLASHVNPIQERLVCTIIRQKIIAGIDALPLIKSNAIKVCLFLPQDEYHELHILFIDFVLKKKKISTLYLGANVSLEELKKIAAIKKPAYLYTHITTGGQGFNFDHFLKGIKKYLHNVPMIISGRYARCYEKKIPPNIYFQKSLAGVTEFMSNI